MKRICRRGLKLGAFHIKLASAIIFSVNEQCTNAYFVGRSRYTDQGIPHERSAKTALLSR